MATTVNATLKHKRGTESSMPTLKDGQLYLCSDTHKIYKGSAEGKNILIGDYSNTVTKNENEIVLYVNNASGDDTKDGTTIENAVKTINGALNKIPMVLTKNVTINLIGNYTETTSNDYVYIQDKITTGNNIILIQSNGETKVAINNILAFRGMANYKISNLNLLKTVTVANCPLFYLNNVDINADNCLWLGYTNCFMQNCNLTASNTCITAGQLSKVCTFSAVTLNGVQGFNINSGSSCHVQAITNNCTTVKTVATGSIYKGLGE